MQIQTLQNYETTLEFSITDEIEWSKTRLIELRLRERIFLHTHELRICFEFHNPSEWMGDISENVTDKYTNQPETFNECCRR